jgi:hypothetical protein
MKQSFRALSWCLPYLLASASHASAQSIRVDLKEWGYKPPENISGEFYTEMPSHLISIGVNGDTAVSFVTRDRLNLATRQIPPLSLHVVQFTANGKFLSQFLIPTPSWNENSVSLGSNGKYLLRTGDKLVLLSPNTEQLAEIGLPTSQKSVRLFWHVFPFPDRSAALLYHQFSRDSIVSLLSWDDLKPIRECKLQGDDVTVESVSNKNMLIKKFSRGLTRMFEIREICGAAQPAYTWQGDPLDATLTNDDNMLLAGFASVVRFVAGGKIEWADAFNKKSDMVDPHVEVGAGGRVLAVAVKTFVGGSRFLDIGPLLRSIKIVVYDAPTGKRVLEMPITPTPASMFDFALSPRGDILAVVSDGSLAIVKLK